MSQHKRFPPLKLLSPAFCNSDGKLPQLYSTHFCNSFLVQLYIYFFSFYLLYRLTYTSSFSFGGSVYMCKYGGQRITSSVFSVVPIFFCETGLLVFNLELMMCPGWLASEPQGASCFNLFNTRTQQDNSICTQVVEAQQVIMPTQQGLDSCEFTSHVGLHNPCANAEVRIFNCRVD